ncbi:restriction endonuclease subunit S [Micromonospora zamorensis]|uniref:restriction endonuclease subunit S n=1 Tax=Micromonospora zamorensis TaxID=709883 RepID=UPI00340874B8
MMALSTKRMGDLVLEAKPGFACGEEAEDGIFQIRMNNITRDGRLDLSKRRLVPAQRPGMADFLLREGDVLFNATNSPDMVGKTALINATTEPTVFSNHFLRLRVDPSILLPAYLSRWLHLQFGRGTFKSMCRQWVNQATVGRDALLRLAVPLPTLAEQRRIVEVLDRADELRTKRRKALAHLDDLTQSIFLDMFGDPATNSNHWKGVALGDVVHSASDGPHVSPTYVQDGVPFISTRHVRPGRVEWTDLKFISHADALLHWRKCRPEEGDILYTKGGTTGIAAAVTAERSFAVWVHVAVLKPNRSMVDSIWLEAMLNSQYCYRQSQTLTHGIANRDLGLKRMVRIKLFLPPLNLQREFAGRVAAVEKIKAAHRASSADLDALFASFQDRAFRGLL